MKANLSKKTFQSQRDPEAGPMFLTQLAFVISGNLIDLRLTFLFSVMGRIRLNGKVAVFKVCH